VSAALILQLIGGAGFLAGIAALLHFLNTWKATRSKSTAEAEMAYRTWVSGAFSDVEGRYAAVVTDRDRLNGVRSTLIDLVQDLLGFARTKGATAEELDPFQDRLDETRAK
jgi:hypothetical protein